MSGDRRAPRKKSDTLAATIAALKSEYADAFDMDADLEGLSTGCIAADLVTGIGGFPRRRISEVFGWESSGKTTLCLTACAAAQRAGLFVVYLDVERGLDQAHARKIGCDFQDEKKGLLLWPNTFEETFNIASDLITSGNVDLLFIDSVPGMVPEDSVKDHKNKEVSITHEGGIGAVARLLSSVLPRITKQVDKYNTALVMVNQMRQRVVTGFGAKFDHGPKEQSFGGSSLRFYSSLRLETKLVKKGACTKQAPNPLTGKVEDVEVGNRHRITAIKNKVERPYSDLEFFLRYDSTSGNPYGIDNISTISEMCTAQGFIALSGGRYKYEGKNKFNIQGEPRLYEHLVEHPETVAELRALLPFKGEYQ